MSEEAEIPVVESEQVADLADISSASHIQMCIIKYGSGDTETTYVVAWDGEYLRLMLPFAVDAENSVIAYKVLGHLEVSLPKMMDPVTMERQSQVLIASYLDGLNSSDED